MKKKFTFTILLTSVAFYCFSQCPKLIWSDEFDGTALNLNNWSYQNGDGCDIDLCGWGNNELQWYTSDNINVSNGRMTMIAKQESKNGKFYTSARVRSINKVDVKYGRIEARLKMPKGQGVWPAFWMMPTDNVYGIWPQSGEIDIMEYLGHEPNTVHGTLHFGQPWPNNSSTSSSFVTQGPGFNEDFHIYALEWSENSIKWYVDGYLYAQKTPNNLNGQRWPFDQRFHFILNMAVGGNWPGNPNGSTVFPLEYIVDYVRLYDMTGQPHLSGPQKIALGSTSAVYRLSNIKENTEVEWSVPSGATITASGNDFANVTFGTGSGKVTTIIKNACGQDTASLYVKVEEPLVPIIILENFDENALISRTFQSGVFSDAVANPAKNDINNSNLCGRYVRSSATQYDVISYTTQAIKDASKFTSGDEKLSIDIYTTAPVGTTFIVQFENSSVANPSNYPSGRHSRYQMQTTAQNEWHRLTIPYLDRPDAGASSGSVNQIIILFAPNSFTGHTWYFDNFVVLGKSLTGSQGADLPEGSKIFPVPVSDVLNIQLSQNEKIRQCYVYDVKGRLVLSENGADREELRLNVSQLGSGTYTLGILTSSGIWATKLISVVTP